MNQLEKLNEKLFSLIVNCEFKAVEDIFIELIDKDKNLLMNLISKEEVIIGLICSNQKGIIKLLYNFYPNVNFWYQWTHYCSQNLYFNEFLDFILTHLKFGSEKYNDTLISKIEWSFYNRNIESLYVAVNSLEKVYEYYDQNNLLDFYYFNFSQIYNVEDLWEKAKYDKLSEYASVIYRALKILQDLSEEEY